jgi:methionyl-tRNA formyltransferase
MFTSSHPIINGEAESGVTLHLIDDGIDTGHIIDQRAFEIALSDTARDLYMKYLVHAFELFKDNIKLIIKGDLSYQRQINSNSTYYSKNSIDYHSISIDFHKTALRIHNQFRAFTFREYQMPNFKNWQIVKTYLTSEKSTQKPGALVEETDEYFLVSSIDYNIKLVKDYYPALWTACEHGDLETVRKVLPFVDNLNSRDKNGRNALIIAASNGWPELVDVLIENGADVNSTGYGGSMVLVYALSYYERSHDASVYKRLIDGSADLAQVDDNGMSVRDHIEKKGFIELLAKGTKHLTRPENSPDV